MTGVPTPAPGFARPAWRLSELLAGAVPASLLDGGVGDRLVSGLASDSRDLVSGSLFLARHGVRTHGVAFAAEAARRGAPAILAEPTADWSESILADVELRLGLPVLPLAEPAHWTAIADRFYGNPGANLELTGVVGGAAGSAIGHFLAQAYAPTRRCAVLSGAGSTFPGEPMAVRSGRPDGLWMRRVLADLSARGAKAAVIELGSVGAAAGWSSFDRVVFADPSRAALRPRRPDAAVERLLEDPRLSLVVAGAQDPIYSALARRPSPRVQLVAYGVGPGARRPARCDLWVVARSVRATAGGLRLAMDGDLGTGELRTLLVGIANGADLLAALATLLGGGMGLEPALAALGQARGLPGQMESFGGDGAPLVVVDDARTPDALEKALTDLRRHRCRRLIAVLGCDGARDRGERPLMGAVAERLSDALILTDDNPRGERGDTIVADILGGVSCPADVRVERQRGIAIRRAIAIAGPADAILVSGRGRETVQDLGGLEVHFSDRAQVVEALREWREGHH
jgi:UDP-N-acetylmuramoyl-L-alanyl-D-glutamate--2,6-diaminopimelate ligase